MNKPTACARKRSANPGGFEPLHTLPETMKRMTMKLFTATCLATFGLLVLSNPGTLAFGAAPAANSAEKERGYIAVLQSNAPPAEKAITCKRLAVYGSEAAVPALAPLLLDPELASWARIAL